MAVLGPDDEENNDRPPYDNERDYHAPYATGGNYPPPGRPYGYSPEPPRRSNAGWIIGAVIVLLLLLGVVFGSWFVVRKLQNNPTPFPTVTTQTAPAPGPTTTATTTLPATNTTTRPGANEQAFWDTLNISPHNAFWSTQGRADSVALGYAICAAYDRGATTPQILNVLEKTLSADEAAWVRAAAVVTLCPEHRTIS